MRIHTDTLTAQDLYQASGPLHDVIVDRCERHGSRSRDHAFEVALEGYGDRHTRNRNFSYQKGYGKAATYDDWGYWLAELFRRDPRMIAGPYNGATDFHTQTSWKYEPLA